MQKLLSFSGYALLALVLLAPLLLGAVDAWAWTSLATLIGILGILSAAYLLNKTQPIDISALRIPAVLCTLAAIWAVVQMFPEMGDGIHPVSRAAQEILPTVHAAISLNSDATGQVLLRWVMYALTFLMAFAWGRDGARARQAMNALVIAAAVYAAYGMIVFFMDSDMAMWVHKPMYQIDVTGPFINKNNFASYLGAALCVAIGLFVRRIVRDLGRLLERDGVCHVSDVVGVDAN